MVSDSFWTDNKVNGLSPLSKLLFIYYLTSPHLNLIGLFYCPVAYIGFDTGMKKEQIQESNRDLEAHGIMKYFDDYVLIKNYTRHQKYSGKSINEAMAKTFSSVPENVKQKALSESASLLSLFSELFPEIDTVNFFCNATANADAEQPQKQPQAKPKPKKEPAIDHTQEIVDHWNAKANKGKCAKITSDVKKAIAKRTVEYSIEEIKATISNYQAVLQDEHCFFSYVWNIYEFFSRANGFPAFVGDTEVLLRYQSKTANGNSDQEPEQEGVMDERDNPNWDRPEWDSKYPKPKSYDKMTRGDVERYVFTCQNEERVAKRKAFQEAEAAEKAAKEAKEAADLAEYLRWDYPFPKPEFWDGMSEPARDAYIRKHAPQEA
jgi:hypothetical protein